MCKDSQEAIREGDRARMFEEAWSRVSVTRSLFLLFLVNCGALIMSLVAASFNVLILDPAWKSLPHRFVVKM